MRKTMKVEVEVTIETEYPQRYSAEGIAEDVRERTQEYLIAEYGNIVVMTVTPMEES